jgi:hypothetical protein
MPTSFFQYEMLPTTWFYVSTLIILASFFKFNRFWSVRNLDLITIILLTPGLIFLAIQDDQRGYVWLFIIGLCLVIRLLFDTVMVRRPFLEPNLTSGGMTFSCVFVVLFIIAALTINRGERIDTVRTVRLEQVLTTRHINEKIGMNPVTLSIPRDEWINLPPGFRPFLALTERANLVLAPPANIRDEIVKPTPPPVIAVPALPQAEPEVPIIENVPTLITAETPAVPAVPVLPTVTPTVTPSDPIALRPALPIWTLFLTATILGHLALVLGFVYIGHCHFGDIRTGIACATLYLLHPYTNQMVGRLDHLIPAALILWGVAAYRRPFFAGLWIGAATALVWYPCCLVPLWCSFYRRRGLIRFLIGTVSSLAVFAVLLLFSPQGLGTFQEQFIHLFGKSSLIIFSKPDGFWNPNDIIYRVPVLSLFWVVCIGLTFWPSHKHLATLLSCSALLMLSVQFWQLHQGGLYMAWYLPLLILTIFRPNLEDRTAQTSVVNVP